ncbi:phage integrase family protein [Mycobacterium intracellulare MIN_061107_1834]|nr:phage integrase family protein [Mycobacterium intracellulare MIN_061107_1834]
MPLGKLATERMVPLSAATLAALDEWVALRGTHRPLPHPRTGVLTDFLFTRHGRRLGYTRLRNGLLTAAESAGLHRPDGGVLMVTPHQLRHTWATELANAGMSLQALMSLLGHVTPQMTIRYATLASPTLRAAYDEAMGKMRRQFTLTPVGKPILPDKVGWLHSEMLKTRVAHGYCARHESAGACPYANICETCDNYVTAPNSATRSPTNSPTSRPSEPTPSAAAGPTKPPATTASPTPLPTTPAPRSMNIPPRRVDPPPRAG